MLVKESVVLVNEADRDLVQNDSEQILLKIGNKKRQMHILS